MSKSSQIGWVIVRLYKLLMQKGWWGEAQMGAWVNFLEQVAFEQLPGRNEQEMYTVARRKT